MFDLKLYAQANVLTSVHSAFHSSQWLVLVPILHISERIPHSTSNLLSSRDALKYTNYFKNLIDSIVRNTFNTDVDEALPKLKP